MVQLKEYFAIDLDVEELMDKIRVYHEVLENHGYTDRIGRSYQQYYGYGMFGVSYKTTATGVQGELTNVSVNIYRSLLRHQFTLITSDRPAFDVRPINTDYKSQSQSMLGESVLDFYLKEKLVEKHLKDAAEKALWSSEGFIARSWDAMAGDIYAVDPDSDKPVMTGDIEYKTYSTLDVPRDVYNKHEQEWYILEDVVNKYDLAARYPEHAEHILGLSLLNTYKNLNRTISNRDPDTDMIPVFTFYHKKGAILPEGKMGIFVDGQVLIETALPYKKIPINRITPAELNGMCLGYTSGFDLLGLQEVSDVLYEATISNNVTFSRQCIQVSKDADISVSQIGEGMTLLQLEDDHEIKPVQLTASSPETYNLMDRIEGVMEKFTGINEVVRGDPSANLRSGNAMALIAAQAIKYNSSFQASYNALLEDVGTGTLEFLRDFAQAPRFAAIVGKNRKAYLKEFKGDDLTGISRVEVQAGSALSKTTAGRVEMATNLLQNQMLKRPEQYISVLETGKLDSAIEAEQSELLNIVAENERLREGGQAMAVMVDNHRLHINEHKSVIDDPEARETPEVVTQTMNHIEQHLQLWMGADPNVLMALGQQPIQPAMMPPQGGDQSGGGAGGEGVPSDSLEPNQPGDLPGMPSMPNVPENASAEDQAALEQMNLQPPV